MYKYFGIKLHSKFILNIKKEFYKKYFKNKIQLIIPVDQQISHNINKVLDKFNLTLEQKNFNITSRVDISELDKLRNAILKYNHFIIKYGKVIVEDEIIKIKIHSETLNEIQTQIGKIISTKTLVLVNLKKTNLDSEQKKEIVKELNRLFENYKTKKRAHQNVFGIEVIFYLHFDKYESRRLSYFHLNTENEEMNLKKLHIREKLGLSEKIMSNRMKLLKDVFDIDISKYQPFNEEGLNENNQFNYEFNLSEYYIVSIIIKLLQEYPLPTTPNNISYTSAIKKSVLKNNAQEFEKFLKLGISEVKNIDFKELKKVIEGDFPFQTMKRLDFEIENLEKNFSKFFNIVQKGNFYENIILYQKLSGAIEKVLFEHQSEKENYNEFIYDLKKDNNSIVKVDNEIATKYKELKESILSDKSDGFNKLYDEYINYSSLVYRHKNNKSVSQQPHVSNDKEKVFIDKYNYDIPFIDQILIKNLESTKSSFLNAENLYLNEWHRHASINAIINNSLEFNISNEIEKGINNVKQAIDNLGLTLLKKEIQNQYSCYTHSFLRELRSMKRQLSLFDIYNSFDENLLALEDFHKFDDENNSRKNKDKFRNRIDELVKELMYLKIKNELYKTSKYT